MYNDGNLKEALNAYQEYLSSFPGSQMTKEIRLRIQEIEAKMKGPEGNWYLWGIYKTSDKKYYVNFRKTKE